jgi:acetate---CoA ligase (ADP-forming)
MSANSLEFLHAPRSVAVVGASDNPDKIGGRPIRYMKEFGFRGTVLPVNPSRAVVQGLASFSDLSALPEVPDVAVVAVPGQSAVDAVAACADMGVKGCIVMASGFGETADPAGQQRQSEMVATARASGMRLIGPNAQGLANFATGAVLTFSTMFIEQPPLDGPVAVISQSGAMSSVPYGLLRRRGLGVRYAHATGNSSDVGVGELAEAVLADDEVRIVLLYIEDVSDPGPLEHAARIGLDRNVPIVALVGGRTSAGKRAALSHTGALATEQRVADAFLERCGIHQVRYTPELVAATELYLKDWATPGRRVTIVSNSGAVCVLGADAASDHGLKLAQLSGSTTRALARALPPFAATANPIDITAALLTDSTLFGKVLPPLSGDPEVDACLIGIPVSGRGYDVRQIADDVAAFASQRDTPVIVSTPQPEAAAVFGERGLAVFEEEASALSALSQLISHRELMARARSYQPRFVRTAKASGQARPVSEYDALRILRSAGVGTADHILCTSAQAAAGCFASFGGQPVAVKACPAEATHKSDLDLVRLDVPSAASVAAAAQELIDKMAALGVPGRGVLVAPMVSSRFEALVGAHVDATFGPVVLVGAGGKYVELANDVQVLLPPFEAEHALQAIGRLRVAPQLAGSRGEPPADIEAWAAAAVNLGRLILESRQIVSVDINPLMVGPRGSGALAVDAVLVLEQE